jgi:di/tricarboxylate transporter
LLNLHIATAKGFSWDLILLVASATLVGSALTTAEAGFGAALTKMVAPMLGGLGPIAIVIVIFTFALIATNVCNNMAILMICYALVAGLIAGGLPINGALVASGLLIYSMWGFLLPSSSMWGAIIHTTDLTTPAAIYKHVTLMLIYILVTMVVIFIPLGMLAF